MEARADSDAMYNTVLKVDGAKNDLLQAVALLDRPKTVCLTKNVCTIRSNTPQVESLVSIGASMMNNKDEWKENACVVESVR